MNRSIRSFMTRIELSIYNLSLSQVSVSLYMNEVRESYEGVLQLPRLTTLEICSCYCYLFYRFGTNKAWQYIHKYY